MQLRIEDISKAWGGHTVLDRVSFSAGASDFVCLLGPSGCGKTTLLRIVAGLTEADAGRVELGGKDITRQPARERGMGIVFQSYSLFPDLTAAANVGYPMRLRGIPASTIATRSTELLAKVGLGGFGGRFPDELSGGQQQRVALARALAAEPALLLLDEPLSALDPAIRAQLRGEIRSLQRTLGIPTIMVTHDQDEALALADTIVCMKAGRIEQIGSPRDLYERPASRFVADFIGHANLLPTAFVREVMPGFLERRPPGEDATWELCLRPEDLVLEADPRGDAVISEVTFLGNVARAGIAWRGQRLVAELHGRSTLAPGESVTVDALRGAWVCT
ncbi:ATP-binding cassette domain-containing protein [Luteibacter aegosomaticola]|uniref:ABC transporter ATP-binding protein n=1 Tax=Luteibacter aegosomaticola TaxID=2911538 RepID=UPI001FFA6C58|nr:ATP-binding cassette domain-containing protein [Luteibacter aegosomaticola]UPG91812.1 ATP-binding cassette domain-containing protein [Luteibacter aegosomaticola]